MVLYSCPRCGYTSNIRTKMRSHFKRKNICSPTCSDVSIEECFEEVLGEKIPKVTQSNTEVTQKYHKGITEVTQSNTKVTQSNTEVTQSKCFVCEDCGDSFNKKNSFYRHKKHYCKMRDTYTKKEHEKIVAEKDAMIGELKKQIELLLTKVGNTTNNTTNNNTINININAYGKENLKYITGDFIKNLIKGPYSSIPNLVKQIHFHPEHKENHNVKIPNRKEKYASIYNGDDWELRDKKETIEDIADKAYNLIEDHYEGGNKHMDKFINEYDKEGSTTKKVHNNTELTILNNQK